MLSESDKQTLVNLYYDTDYVQKKKPPNTISGYVTHMAHFDPVKKTHYSLKLTPMGKEWVEVYLRSRGRPTGSRRGVAIETRSWLEIDEHSFSSKEMEEAFISIGKRGDIKCEVFKDPWGRSKICFNDLSRGIARISYEVKWETNGRDPESLEDFSDAEKWVWCYLDSIRPQIANIAFQQEFVVWDDLSQVQNCQG